MHRIALPVHRQMESRLIGWTFRAFIQLLHEFYYNPAVSTILINQRFSSLPL
jgi:hypothetical protein